ncbi:MobQ family relaxase [Propionivibrio sp.]|uniref:MobQ family relaxase n=1 Tax=Propionivibrio sp. TaxID=2212460 RepID=UPI002608A5A5|nr:MobQ family relaxase [Propionivibrio sp.]
MAIYHLSTKIIGRSTGRTATAAAAYRAGIKIKDTRSGLVFDYTRRQHVGWRAIAAPDDAPAWALDRAKLWNAVEAAEKRGDAQLAREVEISLPLELSHLERLALIAEFVESQFVKRGMVADIAVHDNIGNPHVHLLLTMRELNADGFGKKIREWNDKTMLEGWREAWASHCNRALAKSGHRSRIDHRRLIDQGISRQPERHKGVNRRARFAKANSRREAIKQTINSSWGIKMEEGFRKQQDNKPGNTKPATPCVLPIHTAANPFETAQALPQDSSYQAKVRTHFGQRLHSMHYDGKNQALDIRVNGGSVRDHGDRLTPKFGGMRDEVETIIELAQLKGWKSIKVQGGEEFRRNLWKSAVRHGYPPDAIQGYTPTDDELALSKKEGEGKTRGEASLPAPSPFIAAALRARLRK